MGDTSTSGEVVARSRSRDLAQSRFCHAASVCEPALLFAFGSFADCTPALNLFRKTRRFWKKGGFGVSAMNSAPCGFRRTQPVAIVQAAPEFQPGKGRKNNLWEE
jgi:hypothetical protein